MRRLLPALLLVGALAGCTDDGDGPSAVETTDATTGPGFQGGTVDDPATAEATTTPLRWTPVPGPVDDTVTTSGEWTLTVPESTTEARLDGPDTVSVPAPRGYRITDALIDGEYAVVVAEDELAEAPNVATVVELSSREQFVVASGGDVPTTVGGTWAIGGGTLLHATIGPDRAYCLASVDLASRGSRVEWCAEPRHGFNATRITPAGTSLMTFDDERPSCRTVVSVTGGEVAAFDGVPDCTGWEGVQVDGGAVWSVVPNQRRIEEARLYARLDDGFFDLGPGTSGSLVWCAGAAYFVRDPQRDGEPARLLRWTADAVLQTVYESRGRGPAFLSSPRCGGDRITVTAIAESGDVQVTAPLG